MLCKAGELGTPAGFDSLPSNVKGCSCWVPGRVNQNPDRSVWYDLRCCLDLSNEMAALSSHASAS